MQGTLKMRRVIAKPPKVICASEPPKKPKAAWSFWWEGGGRQLPESWWNLESLVTAGKHVPIMTVTLESLVLVLSEASLPMSSFPSVCGNKLGHLNTAHAGRITCSGMCLLLLWKVSQHLQMLPWQRGKQNEAELTDRIKELHWII